jgi:hypothetical protein
LKDGIKIRKRFGEKFYRIKWLKKTIKMGKKSSLSKPKLLLQI